MTGLDMKYCNRCIMPETTEGIDFDENGICRACASSEQKMHINWEERRKCYGDCCQRQTGCAGSPESYDCIVPISGGKDSVFQLHVLVKVLNFVCWQ